MVRVSILADDCVRKRGFLAEHGLSLWIEAGGRRILFDAGQTSVFYHNAKALNINLENTNYVILSHGHYDHAGGIPYFLKLCPDVIFYMHPDTCIPRYVKRREEEFPDYIGVPWDFKKLKLSKEKIVFSRAPLFIENDIVVSGEVPRKTDFEKVPANFIKPSGNGFERDFILDEQMLIIKDERGIIIFLGCSHPGVVNCIKYAISFFPDDKVLAVIGGMHLEGASWDRLRKTIEFLVNSKVEKVIPLHCTGLMAASEIKRALKERCLLCVAGDVIEL